MKNIIIDEKIMIAAATSKLFVEGIMNCPVWFFEENRVNTVKTIITMKKLTKNFPSLIYVVAIKAI